MASVPSPEPESEVADVDIAKNGDVVFIVGPDKKRIRVHSLFLMNSSPVFNAMLGPHFKEGQQLATDGLVEVELPDDNAEVLIIMFNIIHSRNASVPEVLGLELLLQVAILADKYDCIVPLQFAMRAWLSSVSTTDPKQLWVLVMIGLVLRRQELFAKTTSALILRHSGSYLDLVALNDIAPEVGTRLKVAVMLEEARNKLRIHVFKKILAGDWRCGPGDSRLAIHKPSWLTNLSNQISRLDEMSVAGMIRLLRTRDKNKPAAQGFMSEINATDDILPSVADSCERKHADEGGLCLWCALAEGNHEDHVDQAKE